MRKEQPRTALHFSLGGTGFQVVVLALMSGVLAYFIFMLGFHFDEISAEASRPRNRWFIDLVRSNHGMTGIILLTPAALYGAWLTFVAGWRFFSREKAAVLTERGLLLHPSYRRGGEIPFEDVHSASVGEENPNAWFFKRHDLRITFMNRRGVRVRSIEVEGGRPELRAFAAELRKRSARRLPASAIPPE